MGSAPVSAALILGSSAQHVTIQVKYTNQSHLRVAKFPLPYKEGERESMLLINARPVHKRRSGAEEACLLLDQIKREKGVWWMPWQQEAMKDVITCDKLGGAGNRL
jgi:hypothetical protein